MSHLEKLERYCASKKVRYSAKRMLVASELENSGKFIEATELYVYMRNQNIKISFAHLYTSLNWLVMEGFAYQKKGTDRKVLYGIKNN